MSEHTPSRKSVKIEEIEVGFYPAGDDVIIYLNFKGMCIHRERVHLPEALASDGPVGIDVLRKAAGSIEIDRFLRDHDVEH